MKSQQHTPMKNRSLMSNMLLIALAALLIISPWLITHFWLHTLFHAYYFVPSILVTGGFFIWEITNQSTDEINEIQDHNEHNDSHKDDISNLSIDSSQSDHDLPILPSLEFLIRHLANPEVSKKIMSEISKHGIPPELVTSMCSETGSPRAISHIAQNAVETSWFNLVVRLLDNINQAHNIGMYYFGDGQNPIPAVNVIDVYNFIRYGEPSDGRSSLIKQVKKILVTHIDQAIQNLNLEIQVSEKNEMYKILCLSPLNKGRQIFQNFQETIQSIITPLEGLKKLLIKDGDLPAHIVHECSHYLKLFMKTDTHQQTTTIDSTIKLLKSNILKGNYQSIFEHSLSNLSQELQPQITTVEVGNSQLRQKFNEGVNTLLLMFMDWSRLDAIASFFEDTNVNGNIIKLTEDHLQLSYDEFTKQAGRRNRRNKNKWRNALPKELFEQIKTFKDTNPSISFEILQNSLWLYMKHTHDAINLIYDLNDKITCNSFLSCSTTALELLKESKGDLSEAFSEIMMNVNLTDDYQVLGLNRDCTLAQVKAAYKKLSRRFHPDKNEGIAFCPDMFKRIVTAYESILGKLEADKSKAEKVDQFTINPAMI